MRGGVFGVGHGSINSNKNRDLCIKSSWADRAIDAGNQLSSGENRDSPPKKPPKNSL
jgi:hypothetical protein